MIICLPFIALFFKLFYGKIKQSMNIGNTHYESKFSTMESNDFSLIDTFYKRRRKIIIAQSTLAAKHWFSLNGTKTVFLILALAIFTSQSVGLSHGTAISIYTYINQFLVSLMSLPIFIEVYTRIKDVMKRISNEEY